MTNEQVILPFVFPTKKATYEYYGNSAFNSLRSSLSVTPAKAGAPLAALTEPSKAGCQPALA